MSDEIHMYMAVAKAATARIYPAGEHHPMLVFMRQPRGSQHDWDAAEAVATRAGWIDVDFTRAGILPDDAGERPDEPFRTCYADAVSSGSALMVYETVVQPAPKKGSSPPPMR